MLHLTTLPMAMLLAGIVIAATPTPLRSQAQTVEREVPFLTVRNRTESTDPGEVYGDERSDLKAGWCRVRELDLSVLAPLADSAPSFLREEIFRVDRVRQVDRRVVLDELQSTAAGGTPVIYVHGYFINFEKGCRRASLLQENADLVGRFLWFSWPSNGALTNYTHDEADLYWSVPDLADAILELERRFGPKGADVAGHSLGARGVVLALYEVAARKPDARLGDVVLLAPDMDFQIFARMLPRISPIVESITVYVTDADRPLAISAQLHGYPRLGEAGNDVTKLQGVEVIDLSELPTESPTGHLYHVYSKDVGADLSQLLGEGKTAAQRQNLVQTGPNSWSLRQPD
jgi:esterase/lipase superfamily enzyme